PMSTARKRPSPNVFWIGCQRAEGATSGAPTRNTPSETSAIAVRRVIVRSDVLPPRMATPVRVRGARARQYWICLPRSQAAGDRPGASHLERRLQLVRLDLRLEQTVHEQRRGRHADRIGVPHGEPADELGEAGILLLEALENPHDVFVPALLLHLGA